MQIKNQILHLSLKLNQYEFWDYNQKNINELNNIYLTKVQEKKIEYTLQKEELSQHEAFNNFSIIEKEEENKIISLPFEFIIENKNILPTFQYEDENYILGIRHLLIVECEEYNSSNYIGLFIGKIQNKEYSEPKEIKQSYIVELGSLEIIANFPKLSFSFDEEINLNIQSKSTLNFKKVTEIEQKFYRKIEWVGYLKNSLINKNIYNIQKLQCEENKNEYGLISKLTVPIRPLIDSIEGGILGGTAGYSLFSGECLGNFLNDLQSLDDPDYEKVEFGKSNTMGIIGGILGVPYGVIMGFGYGFYEQGKIIEDILTLNEKKRNLKMILKLKYQILKIKN